MILKKQVQYYEFGNFRLDVSGQQLLKNGNLIPLTHKTMEIFLFLAQNKGRVIKKQEFFDTVWSESFVDDTNLTQHIYRIRKILDSEKTNEAFIETIPKLGYRFNAEIVEVLYEDEELSAKKFSNEENAADVFSEFGASSAATVDFFDAAAKPSNLAQLASTSDQFAPFEENETDIEEPTGNLVIWRKKRGVILFTLAVTAIAIFLAYVVFEGPNVPKKDISVAVLPFNQIGANQDEKLQLGIADTLISNIDDIKGVTAVPTSSVISHSNNNSVSAEQNEKDLYKIARELGADILITGTIQRQRETARVHLRFYRIRDQHQICNVKFDNEYVDAFMLQDLISTKAKAKLISELADHKDKHNE